ncbi:MAG: cold-shock protein, partial [Rhodobacterales bacterium 17-64-5]
MTDDSESMQVMHGRVKWFDPGKGFGFIVSDETEVD